MFCSFLLLLLTRNNLSFSHTAISKNFQILFDIFFIDNFIDFSHIVAFLFHSSFFILIGLYLCLNPIVSSCQNVFFSLGVYYSSLFKHSSVSIFPLISILLINFFQDCSAFQNSFSNCNQTQQIFTLSFLIGFLLLYLCYLRSFLFFMFQCLQDFITLVYIYFSSFFQIHIRYSF